MVKIKTIKLLKEKTVENLCDSGLGNDFLEMEVKAHTTKVKNRQIGLHQT